MRTRVFLAALAVCSGAAARSVAGQSLCGVAPVVTDSARDEVSAVLESGSPLVQELRQEQHLPKSGPITPVTLVDNRVICGRLATLFDHAITPGTKFVVLRVGPLYYVREPEQQRGTGI